MFVSLGGRRGRRSLSLLSLFFDGNSFQSEPEIEREMSRHFSGLKGLQRQQRGVYRTEVNNPRSHSRYKQVVRENCKSAQLNHSIFDFTFLFSKTSFFREEDAKGSLLAEETIGDRLLDITEFVLACYPLPLTHRPLSSPK